MQNQTSPLVTIAVPSFNQGKYLNKALESVFQEGIPIEVFVLDGGSNDESISIIRRWESRLSGWRSHPDRGQSAAINEGVAMGRAPYVCWLNSDDWLLPGGLSKLIKALECSPSAPLAYGRVWNFKEKTGDLKPIWVESFNERRLAIRCLISQPGTLIQRSAWEAVGGLDEQLGMSMDYDLWWKLYRKFGPPIFVNDYTAVNREHCATKTNTKRAQHYREAIDVVSRYYGSIPLKWWIAQPYAVWYKAIRRWF